ncbi:ABC transporter ATP-binding protein, partial [Sphaerotilus sp.]|uniref:ABC transporter ATP-binding protein n=1 Tax=Sphaerotilus sp. TaxID=2093942 RepID=UPI00286DD9FF
MATPPRGFLRFMWSCTAGMRSYVLAMALLTAGIGAFEAYLFGLLGDIVDWLGSTPPQQLWAEQRGRLFGFAGLVMGSTALVLLQTMFKHQTLAGNFPMRLRWNFHRLMLGQSMSFYQDEFAGRVAAKVMQSALAVRDTTMITCDILVFVVIYFVTMTALAGRLDAWLLWPFAVWLGLYALSVRFFVPRLSRIGQKQADARSLMTGRISDAYTNIATVKLFSHGRREAGYARSAMGEFLGTVHGQMRLVSGFEVVNHLLSMGLIVSTAGVALWLWMRGEVGVGALAASTAMALRLNGMSNWVMWELAGLFEHIGTVRDGMDTLSRPETVFDAVDAKAIEVPRGEVRFENVTFAYGATHEKSRIIDDFSLIIKPGEKIGLVGRSGAGKSTLVNLLLRFYDVESGRILIDGTDIATVSQDSLRAQIGMVTQ